MKFKTLLLLSLLLPLLTPGSYAQTPKELPGGQNNAYGIGPEQFYPGSAILELMEAAESEIDSAVHEAYAEGYKAAMLRYAPELSALREREAALRTELERERRKNKFFWPAVGATAGVSFVSGFFLHPVTGR